MARGRSISLTLAVVMLILGSLTVPSTAQPPFGPELDGEDLRVEGPGGSVRIETTPLRVEVLDTSGQVVLTSVADAPMAPSPQPPFTPEVVGYDLPAQDPPLYAPFTYTVGIDRPVQYPATFWVGNILLSSTGGIEHALTDVIDVADRPDGGVDLAVATTEPGRIATVVIAPDAAGLFQIDVAFEDPTNIANVGAAFATGPDEAFHGFGGRRDEVDQRSSTFINWAEEFQLRQEETNNPATTTLGPDYQFPSGPEAAYYALGAFVSSRPYAFWLETPNLSRWRLAADRDDAWHVATAAASMDLVVAPGDAPTAVANLTAVTGRHAIPPEWALGPMVSRAVPFGGSSAAYADEVDSDLTTIAVLDIPMTAYAFEGWPWVEEEGGLESTIQRVRDLKLHPVGYLRLFVAEDQAGTERRGLLAEATEGGFLAETPAGGPYLFGSPLIGSPAGLIDGTDPAARDWYRDRAVGHLADGFDGFMQDFGEQAFVDMVFDDGRDGLAVHNDVGRLLHAVTRQGFDAFAADQPDRQPFFFVRHGSLGRPGSAAYESASWPGDNTADWSRQSGIGSVIPDMLNRGLLGAYGFVSEIGGFIDSTGPIDDELLIRWSQQAALMPIFRLHGHPVNGTQMPWSFTDGGLEGWVAAAELHERTQPLIRQLWAEAFATGTPIARPLWWHHPDFEQARAADQSWLLGPDVLVAPVVTAGATSREVWFPPGCWEPGSDDAAAIAALGGPHEGPATILVDAPLEVLPWFVRCGTDPLGEAAVRRVGGTDRVGTAVAAAGVLPSWSGRTAVLARADAFPDALSGAPLARRLHAPLLLTAPGALDPRVADLLALHRTDRVVLLGGEAALSPAVDAALTSLGVEVERVAGTDRIGTSVAVAARLEQLGGIGDVYLATGDAFADALAVAPLAAFAGGAVLLTSGPRLDPRAAEALREHSGAVTAVGGAAALPPAVLEDAAAAAGLSPGQVTRIAGDDRYQTSVAVAQLAVEAGMAPTRPWLARGDDFADALSAGAAVAGDAAVLLLLPPDHLDRAPSVEAFLSTHLTPTSQVHLIGGPSALSPAVEEAVRRLLGG